MEAGNSLNKLAVIASPFSLAMTSRLTLQPATAAELARDLEAPDEKVHHHLRWLHNRGLVDAEEKTHGNGVELVYTVDPRRHVISGEEISRLAGGRLDLADVRLLRLIFKEAMDAAGAGTFGAGLERFLLPLDRDGWKEAMEISDRATDEVLKVRERSQVRLEIGDEPAVLSRIAILFFESDPSRMRDRLGQRGDSLRSTLVDQLVLKPATSGELAAELGVPVERVRDQLKRLREAGLVTVHDARGRRGAIEYVYATDRRELLASTRKLATYPLNRRWKHTSRVLRSIFKEAVRAMQEGRFHGRDEDVIVRVPLRLDRRGCQEACEVIEAAARDHFDARETSMARLEKNGRPPRVATSALLFFGCPGETASIAGANPTLGGSFDATREVDLGSRGTGRGGDGNAAVEHNDRDAPRGRSTPSGETD